MKRKYYCIEYLENYEEDNINKVHIHRLIYDDEEKINKHINIVEHGLLRTVFSTEDCLDFIHRDITYLNLLCENGAKEVTLTVDTDLDSCTNEILMQHPLPNKWTNRVLYSDPSIESIKEHEDELFRE